MVAMLLFTGCDNEAHSEYEKTLFRRDREILKSCGTCLTREEVAVLINEFETNVQQVYDNLEVEESDGGTATIAPAKLITPGEHEHDENTRYQIFPVEGSGSIDGIEVSVMSDTSGCKVEEKQPKSEEINSNDALETIKGWWYNDKGTFMFNLEKEMDERPKDFKVEADGTVRVKWEDKQDMIIRIIDQDHIAYRFTGKEETEEKILTRGEKPSWAN